MPDQPRPVWLTPALLNSLLGLDGEARRLAALSALGVAWDAAPADPTEAVARAIVGPNGKAVEIDIEMTYDVLRALGMPDA